jgi:beta-galactosidase/beta-glucuronidase
MRFSLPLVCLVVSLSAAATEIDLAKHWDLTTAARETTATRTRICLNGFWQFSPVAKESTEPQGDWLYMKVPGGYKYSFQICDKNLQPAPGQDAIHKSTYALYRRTFTLDESFKDKRICLLFDFIQDQGTIHVNGKELKSIAPPLHIPERKIDVTEAVKVPGVNELRVVVTAAGKSWKDQGGITGNVWLLAEPRETAISEVFVSTSVRKKKLLVELELAGADRKDLVLEGEVRNRVAGKKDKGETVFAIPPAPLAGAGKQQRLIDLEPHWQKLQLWNYENPRLYELVLRVKAGGAALDEAVERFGFCERWVEGPDYYWNGTPLHLKRAYRTIDGFANYAERWDPRVFRDYLRQYKRAGFNDYSISHAGTLVAQTEDFLTACDEEGLVVPIYVTLADFKDTLKGKKDAPTKAGARPML